MLSEIKFHIIVTVYNSESYLDRCIKSVLNQTYQDFNIYLIDDHSTDQSREIIKKYSRLDSRVKDLTGLTANANSGPLFLRNLMLQYLRDKVSKNDYFWSIDSDDCIKRDALEILNNTIRLQRPDIVAFNFQSSSEKRTYNSVNPLSGTLTIPRKFYHILFSVPDYGPLWRKIYSVRLIERFNFAPYLSMRFCEDCLQGAVLSQNCKAVTFIDDELYFYTLRANSLSRFKSLDKITSQNTAFNYINKMMKEKSVWSKREFKAFYRRCMKLHCSQAEMIINFKMSNHRRRERLKSILDHELFSDAKKVVPVPIELKLISHNLIFLLYILVKIKTLTHKLMQSAKNLLPTEIFKKITYRQFRGLQTKYFKNNQE